MGHQIGDNQESILLIEGTLSLSEVWVIQGKLEGRAAILADHSRGAGGGLGELSGS